MRLIKLRPRKQTIVDDEDYDKLKQYEWRCMWARRHNNYYVFRVEVNGTKKKMISMHRDILLPRDNMLVDHINGNGLDNRRSNMRECTNPQNCQNQRIKSWVYKGVYPSRNRNRYWATISANKEKIYLGSFPDEISAAIAYNEAAIKYHGEFAKLNKIPPDMNHGTGGVNLASNSGTTAHLTVRDSEKNGEPDETYWPESEWI